MNLTDQRGNFARVQHRVRGVDPQFRIQRLLVLDPHAGNAAVVRAGNVGRQAVADVDGLMRRTVCQPERFFEDRTRGLLLGFLATDDDVIKCLLARRCVRIVIVSTSGSFDPVAIDGTTISFRGATFELDVALQDGDGEGSLDDLLTGYSFTFGVAATEVAITRSASNTSTAQITSGSVTN